MFDFTKEQQYNFGTKPHKAQCNHKRFKKRSKASNHLENPFNPFTIVEHYVWAALENIIYEFNTQGCKKQPTSIKVEDIKVGSILEWDYAGFPYIQLKENYSGQKGQALTLKNPVVDAENTSKKKTFPCPFSSHPLSPYQTTLKLLKMMPPKELCKEGCTRLFQKPAS